MKVLITGVAGAQARLVARRLIDEGHEVLGVDSREWIGAPRELVQFTTDVRKRPARDFFRKHRPEVVVHMGTVTHFEASRERRYRINLRGTQAVFDHCHEFGVRQALFVGRHTIYGAAPDAPLYRSEDEPPLAVSTFPELADLAAADLFAGSALWRWPELATCVLRFCYTLGPSGRGTLASFLAGPRVPTVLGFDPLFQCMHELDVAEAIAQAIAARLRGVYNVAGPRPVPLSLLIRETGRSLLPLPETLLRRSVGRLGLPHLPRGAIAHLKHPVVIDDAAFRAGCDYRPAHDEYATMRAFARAAPVRSSSSGRG